MIWHVCWQVFNREEWLSSLGAARESGERELALWEHIVQGSTWASLDDVLSAQPRATRMENWIWFVLPRTGVRVGTELDFLHGRVWVRSIETL
jgi:hypothetical protein